MRDIAKLANKTENKNDQAQQLEVMVEVGKFIGPITCITTGFVFRKFTAKEENS